METIDGEMQSILMACTLRINFHILTLHTMHCWLNARTIAFGRPHIFAFLTTQTLPCATFWQSTIGYVKYRRYYLQDIDC